MQCQKERKQSLSTSSNDVSVSHFICYIPKNSNESFFLELLSKFCIPSLNLLYSFLLHLRFTYLTLLQPLQIRTVPEVWLQRLLLQPYFEALERCSIPIPRPVKVEKTTIRPVVLANSFSPLCDGPLDEVRWSTLQRRVLFLNFSKLNLAFKRIFFIGKSDPTQSLWS